MCTLTYLPTPEGFLFTSNRDESTARQSAVFPSLAQSNAGQLLMPLDPQGGGTWILAAENGDAACLLNGAFVKHKRELPYRKSRGRVIVESFNYSTVEDFLQYYNFDKIEPFTLIRVSRNPGRSTVHEIRWDSKKLSHTQMDASQPYIWSSVTLYDEQMRTKRREWFAKWLKEEPAFTAENIENFHLHGGEGDPTVDFKMTRSGGLQTISLTSMEVSYNTALVSYYDLLTQQKEREQLALTSFVPKSGTQS